MHARHPKLEGLQIPIEIESKNGLSNMLMIVAKCIFVKLKTKGTRKIEKVCALPCTNILLEILTVVQMVLICQLRDATKWTS